MIFENTLDCLRDIFGHENFRDLQGDVVDHVTAGGDAVVLFPTGKGKSICYQVPALCREGVAIVISPLLALMFDQVEHLRFLGVNAATLNSKTSTDEYREIVADAKSGELKLLYVSPERLASASFQKFMAQIEISMFAIDEAHCVTQWGHDFRPEYMQLATLRGRFPGVPRVALTATADPQTRGHLLRSLDMEDARVFETGFDRPNISYAVTERKKDGADQILEFVRSCEGESGIVYCLSRNSVDKTAAMLRAAGLNALPYHATLSDEVREANQAAFMAGSDVVMVATVAFGMGIDKPDVRFVAHMDLPRSVEAYYQETGRAGRDGLPSRTLMLHPAGQSSVRRRQIAKGKGGAPQKRSETSRFDAILGICETVECRRKAVLGHFGESHLGSCGACDNCTSPSPKAYDGTSQAQRVLSIVEASGGRFQAADVVSAARGQASARMGLPASLAKPSEELAEVSIETWETVVRQLIAGGALFVDHAALGAVRLGAGAGVILSGERSVRFRRADPAPRKSSSRKSARKSTSRSSSRSRTRSIPTWNSGVPMDGSYAEARSSRPRKASGKAPKGSTLFEALRRERKAIAKKAGFEEYRVVHTSALQEMADRRPRNGTELGAIKGVGPAVLARYGATFLSIIASHA